MDTCHNKEEIRAMLDWENQSYQIKNSNFPTLPFVVNWKLCSSYNWSRNPFLSYLILSFANQNKMNYNKDHCSQRKYIK